MSSVETPLAVTDTHPLIWAASGKFNKLGKAAKRIFERTSEGKCSIYIPSTVLVELGEACHRGTVTVSTGAPFEDWARAAFASGKYHEAELTAEIVYVAQRLYAIAERGDRLIAATAVALDLPLITRDPDIAKTAGVECLWA
jgi:PIN domain nuclease of toxin-antitoxin system